MHKEYAVALPDTWDRYSRFFFALGDTTRQQIVLLFEPNEEICVNDIARLFRISRPAISHHLKILREAQVLASTKRGKEVYYRIDTVHATEVMRTMLHCLEGNKPAAAATRTSAQYAPS